MDQLPPYISGLWRLSRVPDLLACQTLASFASVFFLLIEVFVESMCKFVTSEKTK
jgi:hypothetical protein